MTQQKAKFNPQWSVVLEHVCILCLYDETRKITSIDLRLTSNAKPLCFLRKRAQFGDGGKHLFQRTRDRQRITWMFQNEYTHFDATLLSEYFQNGWWNVSKRICRRKQKAAASAASMLPSPPPPPPPPPPRLFSYGACIVENIEFLVEYVCKRLTLVPQLDF